MTGCASHHQADAMIVSDIRRSASGVRTAIGSILRKTRAPIPKFESYRCNL
jgi:hypothetical protein